MDTLMKDLAYAARTLRSNPGFSSVAVLTIALGIGSCTAIFSVVHAVLLRPLPYADPHRLVLLSTDLRTRNMSDFPLPVPDLRELRNAASFDALAGVTPPGRVPIGGDGGDAETIQAGGATPNLFRVLGVRIAHGRDFVENDGAPLPPAPEGQPIDPATRPPLAVILSHEFWQRRYGGDPGAVGKVFDYGGGRGRIVGVLAPGFALLLPPRIGVNSYADAWAVLRLNFDTASRRLGSLRVVGRLKPAVTLAAAQAELDGVAAEWRERFPFRKDSGMHPRVVPMRDDLVRDVRPSVLALFAAVVFVMLIACANVANLLVVRAAARRRELAIRGAIGGSRWRLMRQLMIEAFLLSSGGMLVGLLMAMYGIDVLRAFAPASLPRIDAIAVDPTAILFAAGASVVATVMFGLIPAWRASRPDLMDVLRSTAAAPGLRAGRRLRDGVVVLEVALSFVLLIGSGLMVRSFVAAHRIDPGFDPHGVLTFIYAPPGRSPEERAIRTAQVRERLGAVPGVTAVSAAEALPFEGNPGNTPWGPEAALTEPNAVRQADRHFVVPGYFEVLRTRLVAGRTFTDADNTRGNRDVVIDDRAAAIAFPNQSAVGKTIITRVLFGQEPQRHTVIGVIAHQRQSIESVGREALFFVDAAVGFGNGTRWLVRTDGDVAALAPSIRAAIGDVDRRVPPADMRPLTALVDGAMAPLRFATTLIGVFAIMAAVLAAVGLYGVLSTIVRLRTAEIGLRIVLGAAPSGVFRMIVSEGLRMSTIGVIVGLAAAWALTRVIAGLLVGVRATDPLTYGVVTLLFFTIAALSGWLPARRAARLDPTVALRHE